MTISTSLAIGITAILFLGGSVSHVLLHNKPRFLKILTTILCSLYTVAMLIFTTFKVHISDIVTIDFLTNGNWFGKTFDFSFANLTISDFLINIAITYPLGYTIAIVNNKTSTKNRLLNGLMFGFCAGLTIELLQFCLPIDRYPGISDIIFNSLSGLIGASSCLGCEYLINKVSSYKHNTTYYRNKLPKDYVYIQHLDKFIEQIYDANYYVEQEKNNNNNSNSNNNNIELTA